MDQPPTVKGKTERTNGSLLAYFRARQTTPLCGGR
jgi:hypothetical protein